ncbi:MULTISPECIES: glycine-rich domain-containing protein [Azotobacter]|nr:hypothetical protein [Azotobacter vinelandii]SFY19156.1 hypothetical protein SAMN04244547_04387 [Azotobacter vinelandii]
MKNTAVKHRAGTLATPDFAMLMAYKNEDVLYKFQDAWRVDREEAEDIFTEMKKFLYVACLAQQECFNMDIEEPTLMIDEMWHTFILFTRDYEAFCLKFFGGMVHHVPYSKTELKKSINNLSSQGITFGQAKAQKMRKQLDLIKATLGEKTLIKWYSEYATRYTREMMVSLRRPVFHEDTTYAASTLTPASMREKSYDDMVKAIINTYAASFYCGGQSCGAYCSCNSNVQQCNV